MLYTTPTVLPGMHIALPSYTSTYNPPPTPTYTGPASGGDDDDNSGSGGSVFSMNGSPPLIVAFLAIGLFTVSMSAIFAWRRMRQGRTRAANGAMTTAPRPPKKQVNLADKPVLREVFTTTVEGSLLGDLQWNQLMPFAATLHYSVPPPLPPASGNDPTVSQETPFWSRVARFIKDHIGLSRSPTPDAPADSDSSDEKEKPSIEALYEVAEGTWVDIAVTIAMPSPYTRHREDPHSRTPYRSSALDGEDETIPEFCIGTLGVPLYEGG